MTNTHTNTAKHTHFKVQFSISIRTYMMAFLIILSTPFNDFKMCVLESMQTAQVYSESKWKYIKKQWFPSNTWFTLFDDLNFWVFKKFQKQFLFVAKNRFFTINKIERSSHIS